MAKFKVGDRVQCIDARDSHGGVVRGAIYTIKEVDAETLEPVLYLLNETKHQIGYFETRFKLADNEDEMAGRRAFEAYVADSRQRWEDIDDQEQWIAAGKAARGEK